jgi:hypothetical protein
VVGVNRWKSKPQRLKPSRLDDNYGTDEAVPFVTETFRRL